MRLAPLSLTVMLSRRETMGVSQPATVNLSFSESNSRNDGLRNRLVVLDGPLGVPSSAANGWLAEGGVVHTRHSELGRQAIQVQADAVEVGIGGAAGQGRSHRVLRGCVLWDEFLGWVQQNGINVGQFPEHPQKGGEFRGRAGPHRSRYNFMLNRWARLRVEGIENARDTFPGAW